MAIPSPEGVNSKAQYSSQKEVRLFWRKIRGHKYILVLPSTSKYFASYFFFYAA